MSNYGKSVNLFEGFSAILAVNNTIFSLIYEIIQKKAPVLAGAFIFSHMLIYYLLNVYFSTILNK